MKFSSYFLLILLLVSLSLSSQKSVNPTPEHIAQANTLKEQYPKDDIVILRGTEKITFGINKSEQQVTVNQSLEEELMNISPRADIQKYVFYDRTSKVTKFTARLRNSKVKYFPVKDEFYEDKDIFYNDARVKFMSMDFPVKGYKYFYNLEKKYNDAKYFTKIALIDEYPMLEKQVSFFVPDWLDLELLEFHFDGYDISKEKKHDERKGLTEHIYTIKNISSFPKETSAPGPSHFHPHILVIAKSMILDEETIVLFSETQQLYNWYKSLVDSMEEDPSQLEEKVAELTENAANDEEKIKNIYYWVQENIRYIAFEDGIAGFKPDESQNVFKKRYGDCKGMANLTRQMLKIAGFDARLTWIGTKRIAYDYSIPSLAVDNHMICTLIKDGKHYFLDSTEKYNPFGEYAERIQGRPVLIENGDDYLLDKVPSADAEKNKEITRLQLEIVDEKLQGVVNKSFSGESRSHFLYAYNSLKTDRKEDAVNYFLDKGDKNCTISNVSTSNLENREDNIDIEYNISLENKVSAFDGEIYIDLEYGEHFKNMDLSERVADLELPHKTNIEFTTVLKIPEGYNVQELPAPINKETSDFKIAVSFSETADKLVYKKHFVFTNSKISGENFSEWNEVVGQLKELYQQQVILTKSQNQTLR